MNIQFQAWEYTAEGGFQPASFSFQGSPETGWVIIRNDQEHLRLGPGYKLLHNRLCGICATDLARKFLPFPLPQVTGHELVALDVETMKTSVAEINDTPYYRGDIRLDPYSRQGLPTHTPGRMVLGIDRLPGGFGPFSLVPAGAVFALEALDDFSGVLIEPFAAAFHAVQASGPKTADRVAVLGPRRLGTLLVAALEAYRRSNDLNFTIAAVARHDDLLKLCHRIGSDEEINIARTDPGRLHDRFDIVFDTTGTESGFELALKMATREVHVKSTSGQAVLGMRNLTPFVVDELSILPFTAGNLDFSWYREDRRNREIFDPHGVVSKTAAGRRVHRMEIASAADFLEQEPFDHHLPHFDLAIATSLAEIDAIIRPSDNREAALIRPRGAILFQGEDGGHPLLQFIRRGGRLRSSRCGDFQSAISVLGRHPDLTGTLSHYLISHVFPAEELAEAFARASDGRSRKVVIKHL